VTNVVNDALPVRTVAVVLFEGFTVLDVYGPVQAFAAAGLRQPDGVYHRFFKVITVAEHAGPVRSGEGPASVADYGFADLPLCDIILIPGGMGTRKMVGEEAFLRLLRQASERTPMTATVCTGSALLARTGLLDNRPATSNKMAWDWVRQQGEAVDWVRQARWVDDTDIVSSSGVSAGFDMALALIARLHDRATAENAARVMEYVWNDDPSNDPFA
jgi:transcriptional regulator GlxA family with amidase domain